MIKHQWAIGIYGVENSLIKDGFWFNSLSMEITRSYGNTYTRFQSVKWMNGDVM